MCGIVWVSGYKMGEEPLYRDFHAPKKRYDNNLTINQFRFGTRKYDPRQIVEAYKKGCSLGDLHRKFGISKSRANRIVNDAGAGRTHKEAMMLRYRKRITIKEEKRLKK